MEKIDEKPFLQMERYPAFINVSRGEAVEESALSEGRKGKSVLLCEWMSTGAEEIRMIRANEGCSFLLPSFLFFKEI